MFYFFSDFSGLKSYAEVKLKVLDINDNVPELTNGSNVYVCESDKRDTVRNYLDTFHINKFIMILLQISFSILLNLLPSCRSLGLLVPTTRMKIQAGSVSLWQKKVQTFPFMITKVSKFMFTKIE